MDREQEATNVVDDDLCYTSALELSAAFRARKLSPVEVMSALLERIDRFGPKINAFVTLLGDRALEGAKEAEVRFASTPADEIEPLCGLPVMVKDLTPTAGVRTTFGSRSFADHVPDEDATIWSRLKGAGAILLGKTTTPEWGEKSVTESLLTGVTNNPWDVRRTVGGSSGGSAAALAAGFGPLATGSDGGGSIRVPASLCGVVGLKPSPGRIPLPPEGLHFDDVSVVGPMTRTVRDCALVLSVVAGPDPFDPVSLPDVDVDYLAGLEEASVRGMKVAFSPDLGRPPVEAEVAAGLAGAAEVFERDLGAKVEQVDIDLPDPFEYFWDFWGPMAAVEFDDPQNEVPKEDFHAWALPYFERQYARSAAAYARTLFVERNRIHHAFAEIFVDHELLLMPATAMVAFPHPGDEGGPLEVAGVPSTLPALENQRCTEPIAHAKYPAISVPCGFTQAGLPIGLQIAGRHYQDAMVLRGAAAYEAAAPWVDRRPALR